MDIKKEKTTIHITSIEKAKPPKMVLPSWAISMQKKDDKLTAIKEALEEVEEFHKNPICLTYVSVDSLIKKIRGIIDS